MSVPKSKRTKSSVDFEMIYFMVADDCDNLVEHDFYAEGVLAEKNRKFLDVRMESLQKLTDRLLFYIKIANSLYPVCMTEWEERRVSIGRAIGTCYAILTQYGRIMQRLRIPDDKYTLTIANVVRMINSLKAWRKSDNRRKGMLTKKQSQ